MEKPMKQLMLFYDRTEDAKNRVKILTAAIKEKIEESKHCQELKAKVDQARLEYRTAVDAILEEFTAEHDSIEDLREEIKMEKENQADEAIQLLLGGKLENIKKGDNEYRPKFSVKWVKVDPRETEKEIK